MAEPTRQPGAPDDGRPADPPEPTRAVPSRAAPREVGGCRLVRELGRGGMGVVYEAEEAGTGRRVAVKLIADEVAAHPTARARFFQEARLVSQIDHGHVVPIYRFGDDAGRLFIVMPVLAGESLAARLERGPLAPEEVARVGREAADGLAAVHAAGAAHRDVKPGNIWLDAGTGRVRLLDFGLAKPLGPAEGDGLTSTGVILGTPAYMAPEQAKGRPVDARTDLFSLGAVLYRAATGRPPFQGDSALAVLFAVANDEPTRPDALAPGLSPGLAGLIARLLSKNPDDRPATAAEVVRALDALRPAPPPPPPESRRAAWALAAVCAALAAAFAAGYLHLARTAGATAGEVTALRDERAAAEARFAAELAALRDEVRRHEAAEWDSTRRGNAALGARLAGLERERVQFEKFAVVFRNLAKDGDKPAAVIQNGAVVHYIPAFKPYRQVAMVAKGDQVIPYVAPGEIVELVTTRANYRDRPVVESCTTKGLTSGQVEFTVSMFTHGPIDYPLVLEALVIYRPRAK